jgi:hypothetical protein
MNGLSGSVATIHAVVKKSSEKTRNAAIMGVITEAKSITAKVGGVIGELIQ